MAYKPGFGLMVNSGIIATDGATNPIFVVSAGGLVIVTSLFGRVTAAGVANACTWTTTPTAGTPTPFGGAGLDINACATGDYYIVGIAASTFNTPAETMVLPIPAGSIDFVSAAANGSVNWYITYIPVIAGSTITVAP